MAAPIASLPLVLLPGFMLDESLWDGVVSRLPHGVATYRLRLAGSTTDEIAEGVAHAAPARFVLVGFSLGGYIARRVAELFPDRVAALVLIASSLRVDSEERAKAKQVAVASLDPSRFRGLSRSSIAQMLHPQRQGDTELIANIMEMGRRLGYEAFAVQSNLERGNIAAGMLACPTLVIAAAQDPLRPAGETEELAAAIPNAALEVIGQSGHMLPLEQPGPLAGTIVHWLGTL